METSVERFGDRGEVLDHKISDSEKTSSTFVVERVDDNVIWIYDVSALPRTEIVVTSEFRAQTTDESKLKIDKGNVINVKMMKRVSPKTDDEQEVNNNNNNCRLYDGRPKPPII